MDIKQNIINRLIEFAQETKLEDGKISLTIKYLPGIKDTYSVVIHGAGNEALAASYASKCMQYCGEYDLLNHIIIIRCHDINGAVNVCCSQLIKPSSYVTIEYNNKVICTRTIIQQML